MSDPPALQGLPGLWCVLLRPLKNQATSSPFSLSICMSPLPVGHLGYPWRFFTSCCSLFSGRLNPWSCFPSSWPRAWRPSLPREVAVGSREDEHGGKHGRRPRVVFFQWLVWESSSAVLRTLGCMKQLSHSKQCRTPGPASSSDVQARICH